MRPRSMVGALMVLAMAQAAAIAPPEPRPSDRASRTKADIDERAAKNAAKRARRAARAGK